MSETVRITIPVAYNAAGVRPGGLNFDDEPVRFNGRYSPSMKNMVVESTRLRKRQGYTRLGPGRDMSGIGMDVMSYVDATGETHLLAFTTVGSYKYNPSTDVWDDITEPDAAWSGNRSNRFSITVVTDPSVFTNNGGTALCAVNNVDDIKYFEGAADDTFHTLVHGFPDFSSCREINEFWNHFMILHYTDILTRSRSLAFAGFSDITDWTGITAGATTLTDTIGVLRRALKLGNDLMIYSDRSISRCYYVGIPTIFIIPTILQEVGLLAEGAICSIAQAHFFLGTNQRVYMLTQAGALNDVGKTIDSWLFGSLNVENKNRIAAGYDIGRGKVMFAVPMIGEERAKYVYAVYPELEGTPWEFHEFAHEVASFGTLTRNSEGRYVDDPAWADLYCDEIFGYCDDLYGQEGYDMACFITDRAGVYMLDETTGYDAGMDINCFYETEDIILNDEEDFGRFVWFSFTARSEVVFDSGIRVSYSTDGGDSFEDLADSPVVLTQEWKTYRLPLDVVSRRIRFRLAQDGFGDLQLRSNFRIDVVPSTARD